MNDKTKNLALGLKFAFYGVVVILGLIGWFGANAGLTLSLGYALMVIAILAVLIFAIMALADEPKKSLKSLLGLAGIVVIFLIAYSSASGVNISTVDVSQTYVKMVGGSLTLLYITGGIAIVSIIISEVYSFFK